MFCPRCGAHVSGAEDNCGKCGMKLREAKTPAKSSDVQHTERATYVPKPARIGGFTSFFIILAAIILIVKLIGFKSFECNDCGEKTFGIAHENRSGHSVCGGCYSEH